MTDEEPPEELPNPEDAVQRVKEFAAENVPGAWRGCTSLEMEDGMIVVEYSMRAGGKEHYQTAVHPDGHIGGHGRRNTWSELVNWGSG